MGASDIRTRKLDVGRPLPCSKLTSVQVRLSLFWTDVFSLVCNTSESEDSSSDTVGTCRSDPGTTTGEVRLFRCRRTFECSGGVSP